MRQCASGRGGMGRWSAMRDGGCGGMRRDDWGGLKVSSLINDGVYVRIGSTLVWMPKIPFVRSMNLGSPRKISGTIWKKILYEFEVDQTCGPSGSS